MTTKSSTRYFLFNKLRPKKEDYLHLVEESKRIDAYIIYKTDATDTECKILKGIIILRGPPTKQNVICNNFPNFILTSTPTEFELDFWNLPQDVSKIGCHPFNDIKKKLFTGLFEEASLSNFMRNDCNQRNSKHIRTMVPSSTRTTIRD